MIARQLISDVIPPLKHTDTGVTALRWMEEFKVSHLPVMKNNNFVGVVSETAILDQQNLEKSLDELFDHLPRPYVLEDAHIYEVLNRISEHHISVVPILAQDETYLGCTSIHELGHLIANTTSIKEAGGILVLEVNQSDYSLAQIAQIVESNNARILSSYLMSSPDSTKLEVTLKINQFELDRIIRTFERYDYTIRASFQRSSFKEDLKWRYDALINYLNM
ncbi:MAG: CBS domain-containing protein [Bacteroidetes bacterium]|nr:MAG: CBS domain-containing protein [Bacteroidota bacterium]